LRVGTRFVASRAPAAGGFAIDAPLIDAAAKVADAIRADGRYSREAYEFLHRGIEHATRSVHGDGPISAEDRRHVSGADICNSLRILAVEQWGPLAGDVLRSWGLRRTRDFGEMVFLLIGLGLLGRQDSDSLSDFDDVYDFNAAFSRYEVPLDALDPADETQRT
jgi:uncharacterized repeat protein (TIGR04138 family)